jgi:hypothetical protein
MLCLLSDQSQFLALFIYLICGLVQIRFLSLLVNFQLFSSHFSILHLDCICSRVHVQGYS